MIASVLYLIIDFYKCGCRVKFDFQSNQTGAIFFTTEINITYRATRNLRLHFEAMDINVIKLDRLKINVSMQLLI